MNEMLNTHDALCKPFETPIVYFVFNRPDLTKVSFDVVRRLRPLHLRVVADGPRSSAEKDLCCQTRKIAQSIDWPCEVVFDFAEENLGCGKRVSSGLTSAFQVHERAIILEDDCIPTASFFGYCSQLLEKYADDARVMAITGNNFQDGQARGPFSYYFSKYSHIWGWATWSRAWRNYSFDMQDFDQFLSLGYLRDCCNSEEEFEYWSECFQNVKSGLIDTWDYQWLYACWKNGGLIATPQCNLVTNVGFREDATHTRFDSRHANMPAYSLGEIVHPPFVIPCRVADGYVFSSCYAAPKPPKRPLYRRALSRLRKCLRIAIPRNAV